MSHSGFPRSDLSPNLSIQDTYLSDSDLEDLPSDAEKELALQRRYKSPPRVPLDIGMPTHPRNMEPEYLDDDDRITSLDPDDPIVWEDQTSTEDPGLKEFEAEYARAVNALLQAEKNKTHRDQMKGEYDEGMRLVHERIATPEHEQEIVIPRAQGGEKGIEESEL